MKTINGNLRLLGESTVQHSNNARLTVIIYSVMEIGGQTLSNIKTSPALSSFLALSLGKEIIIYLHGSNLIGLTKDEKTYYFKGYESPFITLVFLIFLAITLIWVLVQGLGVIAGLIFCSPWLLVLWLLLNRRQKIKPLKALPNSVGV